VDAWHLRKVVSSLKVLPFGTSGVCVCVCVCLCVLIPWLCLGISGPYWAHQAILMVSEDPKMSKQGTAGKMKHVTLIPQKLEISRRHGIVRSRREVLTSYDIGLSTVFNMVKQKDQLHSCVSANESVKGVIK